jgi:hypothetical protein
MDLVHGRKLSSGKHRFDRSAPVLGNCGAIVAGARADVQAGENPGRNPASPSEEAVRDAVKRTSADHVRFFVGDAHSRFTMMMSSSTWLPTLKS